MRRREFIAGLGGAAAAPALWPLAALAQQRAVAVIGYLGASPPTMRWLDAFRQGLRETGFVEGENLAIEYRWAENDYARLPQLAADLIRRRVSIIVAPASTAAALAAKAASATVPIIFGTSMDPIQLGLIARFSHPGGNLTGINNMNVELTGKRLGLIHELLPRASRIAVLVDPDAPGPNALIDDAGTGASGLGLPAPSLVPGPPS